MLFKLLQAGLRELREETGLNLSSQNCVGGNVKLIALWESVFPPKLSVGPPKRHHIVVYFHAQLVEGLTASKLEGSINFDPGEVDACAWLDRNLVTSIAKCDDENVDSSISLEHLPDCFRAIVLNADGKQCHAELPTAPLFRVHTDKEADKERVSTGTKFALQQFLNLP
ncbi:nucleoside diphosphate-linked moiety X motif 17-like [Elysia marginata]|uniref:Nucleoside diphosphate-linked moiety X motif 17-like n=1 Tax=Elysia marginata TaxID=1093978 RepID=A0AAV4FXR7_9GAST|nr:nucleoside diphosphate-linked moiety X motif 17-like [Elysia marginata]